MAPVLFLLLLLLLTTLSLPTLCFSQSDADTLLTLKESLIADDDHLTNWVPGPDSSPCKERWDGVLCRGESIVGLHFTGYNLSGTIDVEQLLKLPDLRTISLMRNSFQGPIPKFNQLSSLKSIYLSQNQFSGEIRNDYFLTMKSLKKIWLNENEFTGEIPGSVMQLPQLLELHLDMNRFSGPIPPLESPNFLLSLNLTNNELEGEIPKSLSEFTAASFKGNIGLCGKPLTIECAHAPVHPPVEPPTTGPSPSDGNEHPRVHKTVCDSRGKAVVVATTIFIALCFIISSLLSMRRDEPTKESDFSFRNMESGREDNVVPVYVPPESVDRKHASSNLRSDQSGLKSKTDLVMVNGEKGVIGLQDLMKAASEVLGNGVLGSAYKTVMASGLAVVVKRMKGMNRLKKDEFHVEMRRFGLMNHPNVLMPLAYHYREEEKLIVTEYMPKGSLLYILHDTQDEFHANLNWPNRLKIIKGIIRGLSFIHTEFSTIQVPHGNLKSSNIFLNENYDPILSDYAFQLLTNNAAQVLFAYKSPEYLQRQQISPKSDIYCLGIVILEIMTGKFPSQYLSNTRDGIDILEWVHESISSQYQVEELIDPEIANDAGSVHQMVQVIEIGAACGESNPDKRLDMNEVITRIELVS